MLFRSYLNSKVSYPYYSSQCSNSSKTEYGRQSIFFPSATYEINGQSLENTTCLEAGYNFNSWSTNTAIVKHIDTIIINGILYKNVFKCFPNEGNKENQGLDTAYYSKEAGLIKLHFTKEKKVLERI